MKKAINYYRCSTDKQGVFIDRRANMENLKTLIGLTLRKAKREVKEQRVRVD